MNIRHRLYLIVFIATIVPTAFVAVRFLHDRAQAIEDAVAELPKISEAIAEDLANVIAGTVQLEYGLVRSLDVLEPEVRNCSRFLAAVRNTYPQYTGIITVEPDGELLCDSLETDRQLNISDRAYFKRAQNSDSSLILQPVFGRLTNLAVVQVVFPSRTAAGTLDFLMVASLDLRGFMEIHRRARPDLEFLLIGDDGTVFVSMERPGSARTEGESIAETETFRLVVKRSGPIAIQNPEGLPKVWGVAGLSGEEWISGISILVGVDRDVLTANAGARLRENLITIAIIGALLLFSIILLAEVVLRRQFARVVDMTIDLGKGEFEKRIPGPYPLGELGDLMRQLNDTAASLERQRADISDLNQKLAQSQKMDAVGQLTGGVAHDVNNLLTVIIGGAEALADSARLSPQDRKLAETVIAAAERAAETTARLLAFARRHPLAPATTDVNKVINNLEPLLKRLLGEQYEIEIRLLATLWPAFIDKGLLESAVLNLCINARDAMPRAGKLTIETQNAAFDRGNTSQQRGANPGDYVLLTVTDNGTGMNSETLASAFEPFFTTKDVGKGSGLGLSMVYGFVQQSGGHVSINSELGLGTAVNLYLPRDTAGRVAETVNRQNSLSTSGREKILLAEDEEMVRAHVADRLGQLGYEVVSASDSASALDLLRNNNDIDLLFTDVVMSGGMDGVELSEEACRIRPGLKVLFTSGYPDKVTNHHEHLDLQAHWLSKPYRQFELAQKVRQALDSVPTRPIQSQVEP